MDMRGRAGAAQRWLGDTRTTNGDTLESAWEEKVRPMTDSLVRDPDADRDAIYQLAYLESQRNLTQQAVVLDNIRTRAGLVITAANVVTAFLGAPAIKAATTPLDPSSFAPGLTFGGWLALISFAIVGVCSVAMLWPRKGWNFRFSAGEIVDRIEKRPEIRLPEMHKTLARFNDDSFSKNEEKISQLFWLLEIAAVFLFLEAGFWLASLAGLRLVGVQF